MSDIALPAPGVPPLPRAERLLGDERLAKLAGKGNAGAFGLLYSRHHQAIYRYCRSILGNDHDAQEALQTTMMRAYAALAHQERDLAVKAWLFRIAHNEAITLLRKRRPEQALGDELESTSPDLDATLDTRERLSTLMADLATLPERQRGALAMRELSGLSIREIAQALSISDGAAKQTLFEARSSLHELAQGRSMECEAVREAISQRDGRVLRGRRLRAHLAACGDCRAFRTAIATRQADLRALAPLLPVASAGAIFARLLSGGGHGQAGTAAISTSSAASPTGHAAASLLAKGLAGTALIAAAAAGTAHLASPSHRHRSAAAAPGRATARASSAAAGVPSPNAARTGASTGMPGAASRAPRLRAPSATHGTVPGERSQLGSERGQALGKDRPRLPGTATIVGRGRRPAVSPRHQTGAGRGHERRHGEHRHGNPNHKGAQPGTGRAKRPPGSGSKTNAAEGGPSSGRRSPGPAVEAGERQAPTVTAPRPDRTAQ